MTLKAIQRSSVLPSLSQARSARSSEQSDFKGVGIWDITWDSRDINWSCWLHLTWKSPLPEPGATPQLPQICYRLQGTLGTVVSPPPSPHTRKQALAVSVAYSLLAHSIDELSRGVMATFPYIAEGKVPAESPFQKRHLAT